MRIWLLGLTVSAALLVPVASASAQVTHPPRLPGRSNSTSANWAGYAATGGPFTSVSASWTQPTVTCGSGETSYASFWVGLDGYNSRSVEQIGTDADCINGTPTYYAWYELYPKKSVRVTTLAAGDAIHASVSTDGTGNFTLTLTDNGSPVTIQGKSHHAALSSAEVIAEAPSSNHGPFGELGLANFGTVGFTSAMLNGDSLGSFNPDEITMEQGRTILAQPSSLTGGESFTITWQAA
jgi:hypothetical protein